MMISLKIHKCKMIQRDVNLNAEIDKIFTGKMLLAYSDMIKLKLQGGVKLIKVTSALYTYGLLVLFVIQVDFFLIAWYYPSFITR